MGLLHTALLSLLAISATCEAAVSYQGYAKGSPSLHLPHAAVEKRGYAKGSPEMELDPTSLSVGARELVDRELEERQGTSYWLENIQHQGRSAFGASGFQVFRNVKDFGAKGDGVTDDTAAINSAMQTGTCGKGCASSTTAPNVIYFPAGTYVVSGSLYMPYNSMVIGNPNSVPTIKVNNFGGYVIDADPYYTAAQNWGSTNVFFRQIRNLIIDTTGVAAGTGVTGIHWPTAQATSIQNVVFNLNAASGTQHVGLFIENGSAGFLTDLTFNGGKRGLDTGNQQFTMRNLVFNNCATAIYHNWDWGWVYQGISINNCQVGFDMSSIAADANQQPTGAGQGSTTIVDSSISNTPVGILTSYGAPPNKFVSAGSIIIENLALTNVPVAVKSSVNGATLLNGGSTTIAGWGQGNRYTPTGPQKFQGAITPFNRPGSLLAGGKFYTRSKPQYNTLPVSSFSSVRTAGAKGDGVTDDTTALQNVINSATSAGKVVFFDAGTYKVTKTLTIPAGAKLVGEAYSVIMSSGSFFNNINSPQPVVRVGTAGSTGQVEWSDMIVSTQGAQAGATLIEWNLSSPSGSPSGMWDVHTRIGGFAGSNLQVAQCVKTPSSTAINNNCIGAYMSMHVTPSASGLYMENNWLWTADHDIDDSGNTQITIFNGRGLYIESTAGNIWLVGTGVEHHTLYQYQFANTQNIYMGFIQTETPYYQPNPQAPAPFSVVSSLNDPNFASTCAGKGANCYSAWGFRLLNSNNVLVYGAGHYSFFNNYDGTCPAQNGPENCQLNIISLEGSFSNVNFYSLSTVGTTNMITKNGVTQAVYSDNVDTFADTIAIYQPGTNTGGGPSGPSTTLTTSATSSPTPPPSGGWTLLGCYTDSVAARSLPVAEGVTGGPTAMTNELCQTACLAAGFSLAGTEYADECYCGNALQNGGGPAPDGNTGCNMACAGKSSETCGGSNRLTLYSHGGSTAPPPPPPPPSGSWKSLGCYTDSVATRTLGNGEAVPGGPTQMTVEACQTVCKAGGWSYAGLEYADECYCDNALRNGGGPAPDGNTGCNMACAGNAAETCGGSNRLNLYQLS
ncbi:beta 1,3 exoglucanase [Xylogone sp. PMI_703]|nr:beta 1,3 exoglucanase [Xylogone sp. PMI_703]